MDKNGRIEWIDLAKGIYMILVVIGHFPDLLIWIEGGHEYDPTLLCRMPLYFTLSGLFFKTYDGIIPFMKKKFNHLLFPYFSLLIIGHVCEYLYSAPNWFLFSLFVTNIIGYGILTLAKWIFKDNGNYAFYITLLIVSIAISCLGYNSHIDQSISSLLISKHVRFCESALVGLPFFMGGYIIRNSTNLISETQGVKLGNIIIALVCISSVFLISWIYDWGDISYHRNIYQLPYVFVLLGGAIGSIGFLILSRLIGWLPLISYLGRYSIIVLTTHVIMIRAVKDCVEMLFGTDYPQWYSLPMILIVILAEIPVIALFRRYLPYLFAQKEVIK